MQAIIPNRPARVRPYAWGEVTVNPNPPRVGAVTRIGFPLANPGPSEIVVERIDVGIAAFGMGVPWQTIGSLGPIQLPPDPAHIEEATLEWTPTQGGHRCLRAHIHVQGAATPLLVGRNLDVIEAGAYESFWRLPFHLGNPEPARQPIVLRMEAQGGVLDAAVWLPGRMVPAGQPVWLEPGQVVAAELRLAAPPGPALDTVRRVEAWIGDCFIDGIQVTLHRPAAVLAADPSALAQPGDLVRAERMLAAVG